MMLLPHLAGVRRTLFWLRRKYILKGAFMYRKLLTTRSLCISAVIAALYAALTCLLAPISYGSIQCRLSEAMTLLPMVMPQAVPGLFVGCVIANLFSPLVTIWDIVFGSLATLLAALVTRALRRYPVLAGLSPVAFNGVIVGMVLSFTCNMPLLPTMAYVALGEAAAVLVGFVILAALRRTKIDFSRF